MRIATSDVRVSSPRFSALSCAALIALGLAAGCGDDDAIPTGAGPGAGGGSSSTSASGAGGDGANGVGGAGQAGGGGEGGGFEALDLDTLLARLRSDRDGTLLELSYTHGWPVLLPEGRVVVSTDPALELVAGDHDGWVGTALTSDQGFAWGLVPDEPGARYKLTDGTSYEADPWARAYAYDAFGEISIASPTGRRLERYFEVESASLPLLPRTVRVLVPAVTPTHVLYAHDGQNLFDPDAFFGGWAIDESAPTSMMIVGIDNTAARMSDYTHVADDYGAGLVGGDADEYAELVETVIRPLIDVQYGEAPKRGVLGSSLGGLVSLHIGLSNPTAWDFVGSLSGTLGWGSFGAHTGETIIERYDAAGVQPFVVYLDSGGNGTTCADSDGDGIHDDDGEADDNYCENIQMRDMMESDGWVYGTGLFHWHEPGAPHDEAAWRARVFRPLEIFAAL